MQRDKYICENIADPETFDWECPTCRYFNPAPFVIGACANCGYEIDPDMFTEAVNRRADA